MTDEEILADMATGLIRVEDDLSVWKWHPGKKAHLRMAERTHPRSGRVTFNFRKGTGAAKTQRTVYRNKLVWLWHHRIPVPDGTHVDHANGFDTDDRIDNLRLREWVENSTDNTHKAMRELSEYFLLAELGFDPDLAYPE